MSCMHDCQAPPLFPKAIVNRPGLNRIDYRIGTYADVRAHLFAGLNQQPVLAAWTHRGADDPAIALLEGAAIVADILTFYQQLYANEAFLRSAQWKQSIAELVRLTGYRLAPGVAGQASFALAVKGAAPVEVPRGFGLKAQLDGIDSPVEFETSAALAALPALSAFPLYRPRQPASLGKGTLVLRLAANGIALKAGERLLLGEPIPDAAAPTRLDEPELVTVAATWEAFGERYVRLETALARSAPAPQLQAYKLGATLRHFGHAAPAAITTIAASGVATLRETSYRRSVDAVTAGEAEPALAAVAMPLDHEFDGIARGATLLVQGRFESAPGFIQTRQTLVRTVTDVEQRTLSWASQTGASTVLTLDRPLLAGAGASSSPAAPGVIKFGLSWYADIRTLSFLQVSAAPFMVYAEHADPGAGSGNSLLYYGEAAAARALHGRRLLLAGGAGAVADVTVQAVTPAGSAGPAFHPIWLSVAVNYADYPYDAPRVTAYGNVVDATQGKTVAATAVGSGDARAVFQTFALPKAPLTYLFDAARTPALAAALEVRVDGILWTRMETLFDAGAGDQVYIVREDQDGNSFVQFGDGKTGARLKSGVDNVVASFRVGLGAAGARKAGTEAQATGKLNQLDKVLLPAAVTTGTGPEPADAARLAAPGRLQSLDRLVSLADYEAETRRLPQVLKASARWDAPDGTPAVVLTVLTPGAAAADLARVRAALAGYSQCRGPARHPCVVIHGRLQLVHIHAVVGYDPAAPLELVARAIQRALGAAGGEADGIDGSDGLFGLRRREFHASVHISEVIAAIQQVAGVVWVQLLAAHPQPPARAAGLPPAPVPIAPQPVIGCPLHALLALELRDLVLNFVSAQPQRACP